MFGDSRYAEPAKSIEDFMALCNGILGNNVGSEPVMTETAMNVCAAEDINKAIFVDAGEIRIIWTVCDGEICFKPVLN